MSPYPRLTLCPHCGRLRNAARPCPYCRRRRQQRQWLWRGILLAGGALALVLFVLLLSACTTDPNNPSNNAASMRQKRAAIMAAQSTRSAIADLEPDPRIVSTPTAATQSHAANEHTHTHTENAPLPPCEAVALQNYLGTGVTWPGREHTGSRLPCHD